MGSFKRALFGYRRPEVDAAIAARDSQIRGPAADDARRRRGAPSSRPSSTSLSGMVIEREREIRDLTERPARGQRVPRPQHRLARRGLRAARGMQAQARGQATRIRMKALREAVEVSRRVQELTEAEETAAPIAEEAHDVAAERQRPGPDVRRRGRDFLGALRGQDQARDRPARRLLPAGRLRGRGRPARRLRDLGRTLLRGPRDPLDAPRPAGRPAARARGALALDFKVRHTAPDNLILDVDEDGPEQRAA